MKKNETKELILMTTIFIIYGAIVMLLVFFTNNYMFLILLVPLAFGQSIIKMFKNLSDKNNISKGMNEYSGKFEKFKNLYENVYSQSDKIALNKKRISLLIAYIILIIGILSILGVVAMYTIDYGNFDIAISESAKFKVMLTAIISIISALIVKEIIPSLKRTYDKLFRDEIISKVFKLENIFEYNRYPNTSLNSYELMYRRLNFDNKLFNIFNIKDIVTRKDK